MVVCANLEALQASRFKLGAMKKRRKRKKKLSSGSLLERPGESEEERPNGGCWPKSNSKKRSLASQRSSSRGQERKGKERKELFAKVGSEREAAMSKRATLCCNAAIMLFKLS